MPVQLYAIGGLSGWRLPSASFCSLAPPGLSLPQNKSRFRLSRSPIKFQSAEAWLHPDLAVISCCDPANISCMPLKNVIIHLKNLSRSARKKVKQSDFKWKNFRDAYPCRRTHQINRRYFSTAPGSSLTDRKWVSHRFQILK